MLNKLLDLVNDDLPLQKKIKLRRLAIVQARGKIQVIIMSSCICLAIKRKTYSMQL